MIDNKSISRSNFSFINPYSAQCFLNFFKKSTQFLYTGLLSSKLVHLDGIFLTCFIQNLVQILMNLVLSFKSDRKRLKKWLKLKQSRKPHMCGTRVLRVKILMLFIRKLKEITDDLDIPKMCM